MIARFIFEIKNRPPKWSTKMDPDGRKRDPPNGRPKWVPWGSQKASKIDPNGLPQIDGKVEKTVPKMDPQMEPGRDPQGPGWNPRK